MIPRRQELFRYICQKETRQRLYETSCLKASSLTVWLPLAEAALTVSEVSRRPFSRPFLMALLEPQGKRIFCHRKVFDCNAVIHDELQDF